MSKKKYERAAAELINIAGENTLFASSAQDGEWFVGCAIDGYCQKHSVACVYDQWDWCNDDYCYEHEMEEYCEPNDC